MLYLIHYSIGWLLAACFNSSVLGKLAAINSPVAGLRSVVLICRCSLSPLFLLLPSPFPFFRCADGKGCGEANEEFL